MIGCATGGPDALARIFPDLPANLPVPLFIVQHMPEGFTASLARASTAADLLWTSRCVLPLNSSRGTYWR